MGEKIIDPFRSGSTAGMNTLSECYASAVKHGYAENFSVADEGLFAPSQAQHFGPADVHIVNFYRFEGSSNPEDMSILYVVETNSGIRGTLVDAYGTYADSGVNDFITQVKDMQKEPRKDD